MKERLIDELIKFQRETIGAERGECAYPNPVEYADSIIAELSKDDRGLTVSNRILPDGFWPRLSGYISRANTHDPEEQKMILHACEKMMNLGVDIEFERAELSVTDEEIEDRAHEKGLFADKYSCGYYQLFLEGAKWMRDRLTNTK